MTNADEAELLLARRAKARSSFFWFCRYGFAQQRGSRWQRNWHHALICHRLRQVYDGQCRRLIINIPPRYSKTEIAVVNFIAWTLGQAPDSEYIHVSYGQRLAEANTARTRDLVRSPWYRALFPDVTLDRAQQARAEWRTTAGGIVFASGSDGPMTGFGAGRKRAAFGGAIIIDDPHKAVDATSDIKRRNVIDWSLRRRTAMQFTQFTAARADTGAVLPYAQVAVYLTGTATLAALYNASGAGIANPVIAGNSGLVGFAAPDGLYDLQVSSADGAYAAPRITRFQLADLLTLNRAFPLVENYGAKGDDTTDDIAAFEAMVAAVAAAGGGKCYISAKHYRITRTIFLPGGVSLIGPGVDCCRISLDGPNPASITTLPRMGNVRSFAIARIGTCPADDYAAFPNATGDYYISPPLEFAADITIPRGAATLPVAHATDTAGLAAGDWLYLASAIIGWHPAWSEYVQVQSVSGDGLTITLRSSIRFGYSTVHDGIWNYAANFEAPANPPGGIVLSTWAQVGWRKVNPAIGGSIEGIEVVNLNNYANYACGAVLLHKAIGCHLDIRSTGGVIWALDCQDIQGTLEAAIRDASRPLPSFACNGSNHLHMHLKMNDCTIAIEEGVNNAIFSGFAHQKENGVVQILHFCDEIHFNNNFIITNSVNYGLVISDHVGVASFNGEISTAGSCALIDITSIYQTHPQATRAIYRDLRRYFDGLNWSFKGRFLSTGNNGLEFYIKQPIRVSGIVSGRYGGIGAPTGGVAGIIGLLRREYDGLSTGDYLVTTSPTRTGLIRGELAYDLSNNKIYRVSTLSTHTIDSATPTSVTINTFPNDGSVQTGDILKLLIINGSNYSEIERTVTSMSGATANFASIGTGSIVTGTDSECRITRWLQIA